MLEHDTRQTLLDHILVVTNIVMREPPPQGRCKGSYHKIGQSYLEDLIFCEQVRLTWEQAIRDSKGVDPRITWDQTWKVVNKLFVTERQRRKEISLDLSHDVWEI